MLAIAIGTNEVKRALIDNIKIQFENNSKLNDLKNYSLYTSFIDGNVVMPNEVISEVRAADLEFYALIRYEAGRQFFRIATKRFEQIADI